MRGDKFTFCYKKMDKNIASKITTEIMKKAKQRSWVARLFDMDDNSVSPSTLFMLILTIIGCVLLTVPAIALILEAFHNHTITTDLNGMASYVCSITTLFTAAGITKAWSSWANYKYSSKNKKKEDCEDKDKDNNE